MPRPPRGLAAIAILASTIALAFIVWPFTAMAAAVLGSGPALAAAEAPQGLTIPYAIVGVGATITIALFTLTWRSGVGTATVNERIASVTKALDAVQKGLEEERKDRHGEFTLFQRSLEQIRDDFRRTTSELRRELSEQQRSETRDLRDTLTRVVDAQRSMSEWMKAHPTACRLAIIEGTPMTGSPGVPPVPRLTALTAESTGGRRDDGDDKF